MRDNETLQVGEAEVICGGRAVWVNKPDCCARFCRYSSEVLHPVEGMQGASHNTPGRPTEKEWEAWCDQVQELWGIEVPLVARPEYLDPPELCTNGLHIHITGGRVCFSYPEDKDKLGMEAVVSRLEIHQEIGYTKTYGNAYYPESNKATVRYPPSMTIKLTLAE